MTFLFWLALVTLCLLVAITIEFAIGNRSLRRLAEAPALEGPTVPSVSVVAVFVTSRATLWLNVGCLVVIALLYLDTNHRHGAPLRYVVGFPLTVLLFLFILWRDTRYPLRALKSNKL